MDASRRIEIGGYRIDPVIDGAGRRRPDEMFPDVAGDQWKPHRALLDRDGLLPIAIGGFLVRGHGHTALVDLGYGPGALGDIPTGRLLDALRTLAVDPADVTSVLFTHLHADHVGWACVAGRPTFPNARFHCGADDYSHFVVRHLDPSVAERLRGGEDRFDTFEEGGCPLPAVRVMPAPGHTPGSTTIVFSAGRRRAVMLGDVVHCPVQLFENAWNTPFDVDPDLARRTRRDLLADLVGDTDVLLAGAHFPGMRFGQVVSNEGRRRWVV